MRIPADTVDRIRSAVDIVGLIGEHVRLTKSGRSFKGLCPFHTEKTPSFMINPERQTYHCFGCGAGGNAITFLIEYAKMSFPEAVRYLADRTGIEIPKGGDDPAQERESTRVLEALALAAELYRERLHHPYAGAPARDYLGHRGLDPALADQFGLGFAPAGWRNLADAARNRFTAEILTRAGLLIPKEDGTPYDRFRNRLMIPVSNPMGRVVGFGARAIDNEEPKYINSPDSPVYQKGQILFGLGQAREALHREETGIVVEGYLDHLRVFGAGIRNVVAVAGTAMTPQHAALLRRYAKRVVLVFDGDPAGVTASWRAVSPCLAAGLDVRVALLPPGHDPDSLIRELGAPAFQAVLDGAQDVIDFAASQIAPRGGREEALRKLVEAIREAPDPIRRRLMVQSAAERLRFDEATLVREVEKDRGRISTDFSQPARPLAAAEADPVERTLMALLLGDPALVEAVEGLEEGDFRDPLCREIFRRVQAESGRMFAVDRLLESESGSPLARLVSELLVEPAGGGLKAAFDCARRLKVRSVNARIEALKAELQAAERSGDAERSRLIRLEITELKRSTLTTGAKT